MTQDFTVLLSNWTSKESKTNQIHILRLVACFTIHNPSSMCFSSCCVQIGCISSYTVIILEVNCNWLPWLVIIMTHGPWTRPIETMIGLVLINPCRISFLKHLDKQCRAPPSKQDGCRAHWSCSTHNKRVRSQAILCCYSKSVSSLTDPFHILASLKFLTRCFLRTLELIHKVLNFELWGKGFWWEAICCERLDNNQLRNPNQREREREMQ